MSKSKNEGEDPPALDDEFAKDLGDYESRRL
jgi:hypothetical protein